MEIASGRAAGILSGAFLILLTACQPAASPADASDAAETAAAPAAAAPSQSGAGAPAPLPQVVTRDGRDALMVDGAPFLILGGQVNNSSNYPAALPDVWPAMDDLHANTVLMPVAWEQVEPVEGEFDFSFVDTLVTEARENDKRLILLWFATWKNTAPKYAPSWVKLDNERFPRIIHEDGEQSYALSPHHRATLEADKKAFVRLMEHLEATDPQRTVIMVQVQNESGVYGTDRDYSDRAQQAFDSAVPAGLVEGLGTGKGTWAEVFGDDADEFFHAWHMAVYIGEIAAAGRAVYDLPMYTNAALRDPFHPGPAGGYASGGPTDNVLGIYRIGAPALEMLSPDIYMREHEKVEAVLDLYALEDNPLFVPEIGSDADYARYFFAAMGRQAIGFSPFGIDYTGYANYPLGGKLLSPEKPERLHPYARLYELVGPFARQWAKLSFESEVWGASEPDDSSDQVIALSGPWQARIQYNMWQFAMREWNMTDEIPEGNEKPNGGVMIADLGDNEFLVTGYDARVFFEAGDGGPEHWLIDRVEEGHFDEDGDWVMERVWNGDQVDYGLNFIDRPQLLRIRLATY